MLFRISKPYWLGREDSNHKLIINYLINLFLNTSIKMTTRVGLELIYKVYQIASLT